MVWVMWSFRAREEACLGEKRLVWFDGELLPFWQTRHRCLHHNLKQGGGRGFDGHRYRLTSCSWVVETVA